MTITGLIICYLSKNRGEGDGVGIGLVENKKKRTEQTLAERKGGRIQIKRLCQHDSVVSIVNLSAVVVISFVCVPSRNRPVNNTNLSA